MSNNMKAMYYSMGLVGIAVVFTLLLMFGVASIAHWTN